MSESFRIADLTVNPGTRASEYLEVARLPAGGSVSLPVVVLHGRRAGPVLVVDAAMHGDEHEGIWGLLSFLQETDPRSLAGTLVAVPILNGPAYEAWSRGSPFELHHYDLNRSFPGEEAGSITQRIAFTYFDKVVKRANAHMTLHGGGSPFAHGGCVIGSMGLKGNLALVKALGWKRFTDNPDIALIPQQGTIDQGCNELGISSVTLELGGASHRTPEILKKARDEFKRALRNALIYLGMTEGELDRPSTIQRIKKQNCRASAGGLVAIEDGIAMEAPVKSGQLLLKTLDPFGNVVEEHRAPFAGWMIGMPGSLLAYPGRILASVYAIAEEIPTE